jgi:hypothetical protein
MKTYLIIIIFLSGIGAFFSVISCFIEKVEEKDPVQSTESFYMNELIKASIENECIKLNNPIIYYGNDIEEKFQFFDLVNDDCLVLRFSGEACNVCVDFILEKIRSRFDDFRDNKHILLVGSNLNARVKEDYYGRNIISYVSDNLGIPFEEYNIPFMFIVNADRTCKMLFIPEKASPELTDFYLDTVKERYFSNK